MANHNDILDLIICPSCLESSVEASGKSWTCRACSLNFPVSQGIPWLFEDPGHTQHDWQNRYQLFIDMNNLEIQKYKLEVQKEGLLESTKDRIRRLIQAKTEQNREMIKVFESLRLSEGEPNAALRVGGTTLPETQSLMSYYDNVCRDWCYGDEENELAIEQIKSNLKDTRLSGDLGVIGAGACRLSYDIHRLLGVSRTVNIDINPYLLMVAKKVIQGKGVNLYEFPMAPVGLESFAVKLKAKAPEGLNQGIHFLLSDGMNPSFKEHAFDHLLTPWLIDIVPQDIKDQFRRYNRMLKPGGTWINFGSLAFFHAEQSLCYSIEETLEVITNSGFKVESYSHIDTPYLHSPYSCQKRYEKIFCFVATKVNEVDQPDRPFTSLPPWIENIDQPVPSHEEISQHATINSLLSQVLQLIDGRRSIAQMATEATFLGLSAENSKAVIKNLLTKFHREKLKGRQF